MQTCTQSLELGFNVICMTLILHDKVVFYRNMFPRCGYICCIGVLQTHITRRFVNICVIDLSDWSALRVSIPLVSVLFLHTSTIWLLYWLVSYLTFVKYQSHRIISCPCPYLIRALLPYHGHLLLLLNHVVIVVKLGCVGGLMEDRCTFNKHSRY